MFLLLAFLGAAPSPLQASEAGPAHAHPTRLLLRVDARYEDVPSDALCPGLGLTELWNLPQIGWRAVEVPAGKREHTRARLLAEPAVLAVHHDLHRKLALTPNDALFANQWYLEQIAAPAAWLVEQGETSVVVAVIDTGVDLAHPDLAANLWTNPGEIPGNAIDDDGNGHADDVHGWDFAYSDPDPSDDHGHGTACAGIVGAVQGNGLGISGVAPGCRIAAVKAALSSGEFYASATVPALVYCADQGFRVLSMSFFSDEVVPAERDALAYCVQQGALPVVAAGNRNSVLPSYPAAYPETLAVGATLDTGDARAFFSNWGSWVNVAAPGWLLTTTAPFGTYTAGFAGTSGAAPQVAGIAALLFSAAPLSTPADVRAAIEDACAPLDQSPYGRWSNYGRVNADAALARILGTTGGSVPAQMWFAAPCGGRGLRPIQNEPGPLGASDPLELEIAGVGFELPNSLVLRLGGEPLPLDSQERQTLRAAWPPPPAAVFQLRCNGALVQAWTRDRGPGLVYAATDASTDDTLGSQATGAWRELYRQDGVSFYCTADTSARIRCEFAVRAVRVDDIGWLTLELARCYGGMLANPIETIELYDWSSASYPYGSWVTLSSAAAPTGSVESLVQLVPGDPNRYRDLEGTFYVRLTTTNAGPAGLLSVDMLRLRVQ